MESANARNRHSETEQNVSKPTPPSENGKAARKSAHQAAGDSRPTTDATPTRAIASTVVGSGDENSTALQDVFLDERNDVLAVIHELEDQLDRQQEIRDALERDLSEKTEKLQATTQRNQELEWQIVSLQTRCESLEQLRKDVAVLEDELADAGNRAQRLTEQLSRSEQERHRISQELRSNNKQLEELWATKKERDGLRADVKTLSTRVEELERAARDSADEKTSLQVRLQDAQQELDLLRAERQDLLNNLKAAEEANRELTRTQEALEDKMETLRSERKTILAQLAQHERDNARLIEQRQFYESEVTSLRTVNRNIEAALAGVKKAFAEVRVSLAETSARARRRSLDGWPRTGGSLRGIGPDPAAAEAPTTGTPREEPTTDSAAMSTAETD